MEPGRAQGQGGGAVPGLPMGGFRVALDWLEEGDGWPNAVLGWSGPLGERPQGDGGGAAPAARLQGGRCGRAWDGAASAPADGELLKFNSLGLLESGITNILEVQSSYFSSSWYGSLLLGAHASLSVASLECEGV